MTGIEKILKTIEKNCNERIEKINTEYEREKEKILNECHEKAKAEYDNKIAEAKKKARAELENATLTSKLDSSEEVLCLKSQIIEKTIKTALDKTVSMKSDEYFSLLSALVSSKLKSDGATIVFNDRDKKRLEKGFVENIGQKYKLTFSKNTADIKGGFILSYGDIEDNCSLEALFEEKSDFIRDETARILFFERGEKSE